MRTMRLHRALAVLFCAAAVTACEKNAVQDLTGPLPSARVKFYNFSVGAPGVNFFANDTKVTAINSASCTVITDANRAICTSTGIEATTGVAFGGVAAGDRYVAIQPGQFNISARAASADTTLHGRIISSAQATVADGRFYSFFQSGIYNTTARTAEAFIVEDVFPAGIDWNRAHLRFVHAISNANPMTLFATNTETGVVTEIGGVTAYRAGGAFVALPPGTYDLAARYAGQTTNVIVRTNVGLAPGRVYTIGARGNITVTTGGNAPFLDFTSNRQG
jgi:hypothetical protein